MFSMSVDVALTIAKAMMGGITLKNLDEIAKSAISEMANMILGNTATILFNKGMDIDITPPTFLIGNNMQISSTKTRTICIPLVLEDGNKIEIDIAVEGI